MASAMQVYAINEGMRAKLQAKLARSEDVLRFADDPALASLATCIGLQYECGHPDSDRLSPMLGVDLSAFQDNPWHADIIVNGHEFGLRLRRKDGLPLTPRHVDLGLVLAPESLDENDRLTAAVIFPDRVVQTFARKGFELVIVRDWLLSSSLHLDSSHRVPYLTTNQWELESNIARLQARMLTRRQLAFSGTHDIVDHLLQADSAKFNAMTDLFNKVDRCLSDIFTDRLPQPEQLVLSYLIGVLLDDLAQPRWYGSVRHTVVCHWAMASLRASTGQQRDETQALQIPSRFHELMAAIRDQSGFRYDLEGLFQGLCRQLNLRG